MISYQLGDNFPIYPMLFIACDAIEVILIFANNVIIYNVSNVYVAMELLQFMSMFSKQGRCIL